MATIAAVSTIQEEMVEYSAGISAKGVTIKNFADRETVRREIDNLPFGQQQQKSSSI